MDDEESDEVCNVEMIPPPSPYRSNDFHQSNHLTTAYTRQDNHKNPAYTRLDNQYQHKHTKQDTRHNKQQISHQTHDPTYTEIQHHEKYSRVRDSQAREPQYSQPYKPAARQYAHTQEHTTQNGISEVHHPQYHKVNTSSSMPPLYHKVGT